VYLDLARPICTIVPEISILKNESEIPILCQNFREFDKFGSMLMFKFWDEQIK
jgi:hypothetical protein